MNRGATLLVCAGLVACGGAKEREPAPEAPMREPHALPLPVADAGVVGGGGSSAESLSDAHSDAGASAERPEPPVVEPAAGPETKGALTKDEIRNVIRAHLPRIRYCYERELIKMPALAGKISIGFTIGPDGTVIEAHATGMEPPALRECLEKAMLAMAFPEPRGGGLVQITYPFIFKPSE